MNKENKKLIQWIWPICFLAVSCLPSKVVVSLKKNSIVTPLSVDISNVQVVNHQIIITGTNLNTVSNLKIKEGASQTSLQIESKSNTSIVANTLSNVSFAAGRIFDFILSNANGASTFTVDFSLCDSKLGGKGFNCLIAPTDKQVLSYDIGTGKWRPRSVNGLNYQGTWSGLPALPPAGVLIPGDYYIVSVANGAYNVGDWIVLNQDGVTFEQVENSAGVISVFGRNGNVVAAENDYVLDKMGDVDLSTPPTSGDTLVFDGSHWVAGTAGGGGAPSGGAGGDLAGTYPNPTIGTNKITDAHIANAAISQTKINGLATSLSGKEPAITGAATTTYFRGDKTFVTLDTSAVPEGSRLYFTNARALGILLAGFDNTLTGQVSAADSMLQGFGRLQNQINSLNSGGSNYLVKNGADTISGTVSLTNVLTASGAGDIVVPSIPLTMTSAINKTYADGKLDKTTGGVVAGVLTLDNDLKIKSGSNYVTIRGNAATAADYNFVLPVNAGTAGYLLSTDGNGNTSWVTAGGGGAPTGAATGDLGGNYPAPTVATVGGVTAANVATGANLANAATNLNTASVIVKRDASGNFSAGTITATLNGTATNVSGTVAVANGGTGATTLGLNQLLFGNGTGVIGTLATTATPSVLLSAVTTGAPTWTTSTAGNVLKGSVTGVEFGALALSDLPAGTLSGSGTANYIPYYSAASTLTNSPLAVLGANVGIGTTTPGYLLDANGTIASNNFFVRDGTTTADIGAGYFQMNEKTTAGQGNALIIQAGEPRSTESNEYGGQLELVAGKSRGTGDSVIKFSTASPGSSGNGLNNPSEKMRITGSGNVGIGTPAPGALLDVKGAIRMSGATSGYTGFQPAAAAGSTVWTLPAADGTSGQILRTNGAGVLSWVNDNSGAGAFTGTASRAVATDGAGALTTTATTATELGYVAGVTSAIQTQLDAKEPTITAGTIAQYLRGDKTLGTFSTDVRGSTLTGLSSTAGNIAATDTVLQAFGKMLNTQTDYVSKSGDNTVTGSFNITGITAFLDIPTPTGTTLSEAANVDYVKTYVGANGQWSKGSGGNAADIYFNTGNVGIGTNSPSSLLHVSDGDIAVDDAFSFQWGSGTARIHGSDSSNMIQLITNNLSRLFINSSGNIGIGTSGPSFALSIGDGTNTDGSIMAKGYGSVGTDGLALTVAGAGTRMFWYPKKAAFRAGEVWDVKWDDANIGNHSAAFGVDTLASGNTSFAVGEMSTASEDGTIAMGWNSTASGVNATALGEGATSSGMASVAIGTSAVASAERAFAIGETVTASGENSLAMGKNTTAASLNQSTFGSYNMPIGTENALSWVLTDPLFVVGNGTGSGASRKNAMMILKNGNVGLGTSTPGAPLDVKGAIRMSGATSGYVGFQPAAAAGSTVWTLPAADGTVGQVLSTNGAGVLSWTAAGGGAFSGTASRAVATDGAGALTTVTTTAAELGYVNGVTSSIQTQLNAKEPTITAGTSSQYLKGDKTLGTFLTDIMNSLLTGISFATNSAITATDNLLAALGKLQAQITTLASSKLNLTGGTLTGGGTIRGVPNPTNADDVANKGYVDGYGQWSKSGSDVYRTVGSVGIGTSSLNATLTVQGAAVSRSNIIATGATVNLALANNHLLKAPGGSAITLQNPVDGGVYTMVVADTTSRTYTFSGCTNSYFSPENGATIDRSTYTVMVVVDGTDTECYITWITGFN